MVCIITKKRLILHQIKLLTKIHILKSLFTILEYKLIGNIKDFNEEGLMDRPIELADSPLRELDDTLLYKETILENINDAVISTDLNFNITSWNKAAEKIYGWKKNEVLGKPVHEITKLEYPNDNMEDVVFDFFKVGFWNGEVIQKTKNGSRLWIFASVSLIKDKMGNQIGAVSVNHDITNRKEIEEKLRESEENFRNLAEYSPNMIFINQKGRIVYANKRCEEIMGYTRDEFYSSDFDFFTLISPESIGIVKISFEKHMHNENVKPYEYSLITKKGRKIEAIITSKLIKYNKEKAIIGIITDISERKKKEKEMRKQLMNFDVEEGNIYLVKEDTPSKSIGVFNELIKVGYSGLILSRAIPERFKGVNKNAIDFRWIAEKDGKNIISPDINQIKELIENLKSTYTILIDRLDYLIIKNGFKKIISLIYKLREISYFNHHIIIISIDPSTLNGIELRQLEKETNKIETRFKIKIPEDMREILYYIYKKNIMGVKPSYSEITSEVMLSKPTIRKKLRKLIENGYLRVYSKGRMKVVESTERNISLFLK